MPDNHNRSIPGINQSSELSRRDFLKRTSLAAVGMVAFNSLGHGAESPSRLTVNGLPATVLGRTGLKVTRITMGGILASEPPLVIRAIEKGFNLVHTATGYMNGRSIETIGKVMKTHRNKVVLALKVQVNEQDNIPGMLDRALKILNTDHVDILVPEIDKLEVMTSPKIPEAFQKVKEAGKARFLGFSCHATIPTLEAARKSGWYDCTLMSYSRADDPKFLAAIKRAHDAGMGILAMKGLPKAISRSKGTADVNTTASLCHAMLTKKYAHTVLATMGSYQIIDMYHDILQNKLAFYDPALEERYWASQVGSYCGMCGNCLEACPVGVDIPRIIRYRMYHKDYGLTEYARSCYAALTEEQRYTACIDCGECESVCARRLPLRRMMAEAHTELAGAIV